MATENIRTYKEVNRKTLLYKTEARKESMEFGCAVVSTRICCSFTYIWISCLTSIIVQVLCFVYERDLNFFLFFFVLYTTMFLLCDSAVSNSVCCFVKYRGPEHSGLDPNLSCFHHSSIYMIGGYMLCVWIISIPKFVFGIYYDFIVEDDIEKISTVSIVVDAVLLGLDVICMIVSSITVIATFVLLCTFCQREMRKIKGEKVEKIGINYKE